MKNQMLNLFLVNLITKWKNHKKIMKNIRNLKLNYIFVKYFINYFIWNYYVKMKIN